MQLQSNFSLKKYNTFGIDAKAAHFVAVKSEEAFREALQLKIKPKFILGGGSNLLLTQDYPGLVIKNEILGIEIVRTFKNTVHVAVGGGENWHKLVLWCIDKGLGGVENMSLIPGTVGAAPIQNIGAYGAELKDVFLKLEALDTRTGHKKIFRLKDCHFGYRDSIFKRKLKGKIAITKVYLRLSKHPKVNTAYGAIREILDQRGIHRPGIREVSEAVIHIRQSKLPDPAKLGNSGSFFKNPEIGKRQFQALQKEYPAVPHYPLPSGKIKIPAGWLIEQCGWKGKKVGKTGAHARQALVLVNYGGATGKEIYTLAQKIIKSVDQRFGITLNPEVNVV